MASGKATLRSKKARAAARVRLGGFAEDEEGNVSEKDATIGALGPGMAAARRTAIEFFSVNYYGSLPESQWGGRGGVISLIMRRVGVPEGSKGLVRKVFEDATEAQEKDEAYNLQWEFLLVGLWAIGQSQHRDGRGECRVRGDGGGSRRLPWPTSSALRRTRTASL